MLKTARVAAMVLTGGLFSVAASTAQAEDVYAGFTLGQVEAKDWCDGINGVGVSCDDTSLTGRIYGGGFFDRYLAFEGGYRYVDDHSISISDASNRVGLDVSYHMVDSSLLVFTPEIGPFRLFGKVGAQFWYQKGELSGAGPFSGSDSETGAALRTGAGAILAISDGLSVRLEWDYLKDVGESDTIVGSLESDMHVFSIGPEFHF